MISRVIPNAATPITPELVAEHGLKPDEYQRILDLIGREPTLTELGIFSAMWNEHCSYKSSKVHLRTLPTKGPHVIQGPGENAGVIDIGDGLGLRVQDGEPQPPELHRALSGRGDRRRRHSARRVHHGRAADRLPERAVLRRARASRRRGIWSPAWSPASAATAIRSACRRSAARCASTRATTATSWSTPWRSASREKDKIFYSAASGVGMPIVYLGSKTGRDGIHGASHGVGRIRRGHRREAPDRAGRRSVLGKAAARSLPRDHGQRLRHRHPGHGRGGPDLLGGRDGRQGRSRRHARSRQGAVPRRAA